MAMNITVLPGNSGTVTSTLLFTWDGPGDDSLHTVTHGSESYFFFLMSDMEYEIRVYGLTAVSADGYRFGHYLTKQTITETRQGQTTVTTNEYQNTNDQAVTINGPNSSVGLYGYRRETYPSSGAIYEMDNRNVVARFFVARSFTDLLVNSSDHTSPVGLVYDPTTGLLVADY